MLGKLTWSAIPFDQPIPLIASLLVMVVLAAVLVWVVVKGYDKDTFYINDPYSDSTITLDTNAFKSALGFEENYHMIAVHSKSSKKQA